MRKGCLLSLIALLVSSFLVFVPLQGIFNYMDWPVFNGAGLHAGTWIVAFPFMFGTTYCLLLWLEQLWRERSKHHRR